nr:unnamed protein product [Digitaria exilis]
MVRFLRSCNLASRVFDRQVLSPRPGASCPSLTQSMEHGQHGSYGDKSSYGALGAPPRQQGITRARLFWRLGLDDEK